MLTLDLAVPIDDGTVGLHKVKVEVGGFEGLLNVDGGDACENLVGIEVVHEGKGVACGAVVDARCGEVDVTEPSLDVVFEGKVENAADVVGGDVDGDGAEHLVARGVELPDGLRGAVVVLVALAFDGCKLVTCLPTPVHARGLEGKGMAGRPEAGVVVVDSGIYADRKADLLDVGDVGGAEVVVGAVGIDEEVGVGKGSDLAAVVDEFKVAEVILEAGDIGGATCVLTEVLEEGKGGSADGRVELQGQVGLCP